MRPRCLSSLLLPLALFFGLSACSTQNAEPLDIGTNVWPGYEPGYLAEAEGLFGDAPLRMRQFTSATEVLRAFRNEAIDVAALTLDEVLLLAQDGIDVVVILVADISAGADVIVARPGLADVSALAGQRVAVENTALGAYVLARALEMNGVDPSTVEILPMTVDESVSVYQEERADAVVTFDPFRTKLLELGARQVFSSAEIPGEVVDVLVTRRSTLEARGPALQRLVSGWLAAIQLLETSPERAGALIGQRLELTPEEALASFDGLTLPDAAQNRRLLAGTTPTLPVTAQRLQDLLVSKGLLREPGPLDGLADGRLIPAP